MHKIMYSFSIIAIFYGQRAEPISVWRIPLPMSTVCTNNSIKCLFLILCDFLTRFSFLVVEKTKNKSFSQQFFNNFVYFLVYPPFVQCKKQSKQKKIVCNACNLFKWHDCKLLQTHRSKIYKNIVYHLQSHVRSAVK